MATSEQFSDGAECPTCGQMFNREVDMKRHRKMSHGKSLRDTVTLVCEWCGGEYTRSAGQEESSRFCSHECQNEHRRENDGCLSTPTHHRHR